jgi:ribosome-associated protein
MTLRARDFLELARLSARCADDKKAQDVAVLAVGKVTGLADYFVLASVDSQPQLAAVQDHVAKSIKEVFGLSPLHRDGVGSGQWTVLDYGGTVVHLFRRDARAFYGLERLWEGARAVEWKAAPPKKRAPRKKPARRKTR